MFRTGNMWSNNLDTKKEDNLKWQGGYVHVEKWLMITTPSSAYKAFTESNPFTKKRKGESWGK